MYDVKLARRRLLGAVQIIVGQYDQYTATYRGWLEQSLQAGHEQRQVDEFERKLTRHLGNHRQVLYQIVSQGVEIASESARDLAGDDFRGKTTQSARRDLELLSADEIYRTVLTQLQRDLNTLVHRRARERLRQIASGGIQLGIDPGLDPVELYRPDRLGRRRNAQDYITVEVNGALFSLTNTLTYALMLQRGDTMCTLDHALEGGEIIQLKDFLDIQKKRMHPRSTLLIHSG